MTGTPILKTVKETETESDRECPQCRYAWMKDPKPHCRRFPLQLIFNPFMNNGKGGIDAKFPPIFPGGCGEWTPKESADEETETP
jgi:hypothetical protein